ncbi:hypothetical protein ACI8AK_05350 [Geodermatophilus sp. SYSU D00867]
MVTEDQLRTGTQDARSAFLLLRAIDEAFATVVPYAARDGHGRLGHHVDVLCRLGRYNADAAYGAVIPRRAFPARPNIVPDHEAEHFEHLLFVPCATEPGTRLRLRHVPAAFDFRAGTPPRLVVGCVAFVKDLDELDIRRIEDFGAWYSIRPRLAGIDDTNHWRRRIEAALCELDRSGAHIGVLPELALNDELLDLWKQTLLRVERPRDGHLHWILVGSGPLTAEGEAQQPRNQAVLLHRETGREVLRQDKCEPFTLDDAQLHDWQLAGHLAPGPVAEWMKEGRDRHVLDSRVGRIAILICEDQARLFTVGSEVSTLGPTHLFIPIFAPPIVRFRWQENAARQFATHGGSCSVVTTSCAVKLPPHVEASTEEDQYGTALAVVPRTEGRASDSWASVDGYLQDAAGDPVRVLTFELPCC